LASLDCVALHVPDNGTDAERIAFFQAAGYAVLVWTVNDMARAQQLIDWGVNGVITDAVDRVFSVRP
jgi:glycerophosphoryl diester phosphodiesterase